MGIATDESDESELWIDVANQRQMGRHFITKLVVEGEWRIACNFR
jgi:hypothetical protein